MKRNNNYLLKNRSKRSWEISRANSHVYRGNYGIKFCKESGRSNLLRELSIRTVQLFCGLMAAAIPIGAALKGVSLRQQDYKDNFTLSPHSFPGNLIYQNQNLSGSRCQAHRNKKDRLLNKCCLESGFHTLSRSCPIEVVLIFPTSKHAFIIADNSYSYSVLLIVLD